MFYEKRVMPTYKENPVEARAFVEASIYKWVPKEEDRDKVADLACAAFDAMEDTSKELIVLSAKNRLSTEGLKELTQGLVALRADLQGPAAQRFDTLMQGFLKFSQSSHEAVEALKKYTDKVPRIPSAKEGGIAIDSRGVVVELSKQQMDDLRRNFGKGGEP
jgi:hypothetical protein